MPLSERISTQLIDLQKRRNELVARMRSELAAVDANIETLQRAARIVTPELEAVYAELLGADLIKEI